MAGAAKQVRFTQLVKASGKPHPATLWVADPAKDPEFKKAIAENRILTVHHVNVGSKKESGTIGFHAEGSAGYLIFPKALATAEGTRVIGLKFDMLEEASVKDPVKIKEAKRKPKIEPVKVLKFPQPEAAEKPKPKEKAPELEKPRSPGKKTEAKTKALSRFKITVEFTATATREIEVEAKNAAEAIEAALKEGKKHTPKVGWEMDATNVTRCD